MAKVLLVVVSLWFAVFLCSMFGCSSGHSPCEPSPIETETSPDPSTGIRPATAAPGHHLLGAFSMQFDPGTKTLSVVPNREAMAHFNVTPFLLPPYCDDCFSMELLEFWPEQYRMQVKVRLKNPFQFEGKGVRIILMHNQPGWDIEDNRGYTSLFDDGGDVTINPFITRSTLEPGESTSNIHWITFPEYPDFHGFNIIVEASWPDFCDDVFEIRRSNLDNDAVPVDYGGSLINFRVVVKDWQDDIVSITMDATEIGVSEVDFYQYSPGSTSWCAEFFCPGTSGGPLPGGYRLLVTALSNSPVPTYTYVDFFLNPLPPPEDVTPGSLQYRVHEIYVWDGYRLITGSIGGRIDIFDISPAGLPVWASSVKVVGYGYEFPFDQHIEVVGEKVFVSANDFGVYAIDIESTLYPDLLGAVEFNSTGALASGEGYLYCIREIDDSESSIVIIDPDISPIPQIVGEFAWGDTVESIIVQNGYLFFTSGYTMYAADLTDPITPSVVGETILPHNEDPTTCYYLRAQGDFIYGITAKYLSDPIIFACDISDPVQLDVVGSYATPFHSAWGFCIYGDYAYANMSVGCCLIDINPPDEIHFVGEIETMQIFPPGGLAAGTEFIYGSGLQGLTVYDPDPPTQPQEVTHLKCLGDSDRIYLAGDYAYLFEYKDNGPGYPDTYIWVLDIDPPERTRVINRFSIDSGGVHDITLDVDMEGDVACILKSVDMFYTRLLVLSFADPENPVVAADVACNIDFDYSIEGDVFIENGYAYVKFSDKFHIFDVDPPEDTYQVQAITVTQDLKICDAKQDRLYTYCDEGLKAWDISDPEDPQIAGVLPYFGNIYGFTARKNYVYASGADSIMVIHVADPQAMEIVADTQVMSASSKLSAIGGFLFSGSGSGLWIARIFPPGTIEPVFNIEATYGVCDVACQDGYIYFASIVSSLFIYRWW